MSNIVPEDFDLERARHQHSSTPPGDRDRCPNCHTTAIRRKIDKPNGRRAGETKYCCEKCGHHFDDPVKDNA